MLETRRYQIRGIVQGVGFRPFVYRTAELHSLAGWIRNDSEGVVLEVQGDPNGLEAFVSDVQTSAPQLARIDSVALLERRNGETLYDGFAIEASDSSQGAATLVPADTFVCDDCARELLDPDDRRYRYPFINCTNCGPRFSIVSGVPYDRPLTTMAGFPMCEACEGEYHDISDRRFHAQPIACWDCGPRVQLWDPAAGEIEAPDPLAEAAGLLKDGAIVAAKGIGGFHLMVDARNDAAVRELRRRKKRDERPFALMSPSLESVERYAEVGELEAELLTSTARPIVLVRRRADSDLAESVAPGNSRYGAMLGYAPLHLLLFEKGPETLVATSGNLSEEPIAFENEDAMARLSGIADAFLIHNRDIHTRVDDSIVRVVPLRGKPTAATIRRARGYTPDRIVAPFEPPPLLAVGPELKNTICMSRGRELVMSHHIGDLKNAATARSFTQAIEHLSSLLEVKPELIAHDAHPGYASTRYARDQAELPTVAVQHHHAHMAACMCEHGLTERVLGVIFDGTGYGTDGEIWGGEFLIGDYGGFKRAAHLEYFPLPGGDMAVREPFRVALSLLAQADGSYLDLDLPVVTKRSELEREVISRMIERRLHSPLTSSMGRLFDGVAALIGVRERVGYEAQAAIELEQLVDPSRSASPLSWELDLSSGRPYRIDVRPMVRELVAETERGAATAGELSHRFHLTVVDMVRKTCMAIRDETGIATVVLSGGVFLNEFLLRSAHEALDAAGFRTYTHERVPTNDGGVSLGQAAIAGWRAR